MTGPDPVGPPGQLLVESRGPGDTGGARFLRAASHLAGAGTPVTVYLVDDGVGFAHGAHAELADLLARGVRVVADGSSLVRRGVRADLLVDGVSAVEMTEIESLVFDPAVKVVWH